MKTIRLVIVAVGGQGNLLASKVLGEAALHGNVPVRMSEIHGMAQRGGVVASDMLFGDGKSTIIPDGYADVLLSFEPLEALRALNRCNAGTTVITNLASIVPVTATIGKGTYPDIDTIKQKISESTARLIAFDAAAPAKQAGTIMSVNMVLVGALIQTEIVPIPADHVRQVIRTKTKKAFVDINLTAFELGFAIAADACQ